MLEEKSMDHGGTRRKPLFGIWQSIRHIADDAKSKGEEVGP